LLEENIELLIVSRGKVLIDLDRVLKLDGRFWIFSLRKYSLPLSKSLGFLVAALRKQPVIHRELMKEREIARMGLTPNIHKDSSLAQLSGNLMAILKSRRVGRGISCNSLKIKRCTMQAPTQDGAGAEDLGHLLRQIGGVDSI